MNDNDYNMKVAIIGAGPAGMFAAWEFSKLGYHVSVFERGGINRFCPDHYCKVCPRMAVCGILCGLGGAGGYSDGKITLSPGRGVQTGSSRPSSIPSGETLEYLDSICTHILPDSEYIEPLGKTPDWISSSDFELFESYPLRFYGTTRIRELFSRMVKILEREGVEFHFGTEVTDLKLLRNGYVRVVAGDSCYVPIDYVVLAAGSFNQGFIENVANSNGVHLDYSGDAGLGVRLESPARVLEPLIETFYDFKLYHTVNGITSRSFCVNRGGSITNELRHREQLVSINGRSEQPMTSRSNMAIIAKVPEGKERVREVAHQFYTKFGVPGGQTFWSFLTGDPMEEGEKAYIREIRSNCEPTDLTKLLPKDVYDSIKSYILSLMEILPDLQTDTETIIYAPEIKYHMPKWPLNTGFAVEGCEDWLQVIGNTTGDTDSISTAACSGIEAARYRYFNEPE